MLRFQTLEKSAVAGQPGLALAVHWPNRHFFFYFKCSSSPCIELQSLFLEVLCEVPHKRAAGKDCATLTTLAISQMRPGFYSTHGMELDIRVKVILSVIRVIPVKPGDYIFFAWGNYFCQKN